MLAPLALLLATPAIADQPPIDLLAPKTTSDKEAGTHDLRAFTCPLGGETFTHDVGYMALPLLTLPDGSWLGDDQIGAQVPVCPSNGLVLLPDFDAAKSETQGSARLAYVTYSADEVARLPALIADPEYRILAAEGRYVQAWWIATRLGRPAYDRYHLLQRSTWATRDPALRRRLVERFAAEAPTLIAAANVPEGEKIGMQVMLANALRELGRFDEAKALVGTIGDYQLPEAEMTQLSFYRAIEQRDDGRIPAELAPRKILHLLCSGGMVELYGPLTEGTQRGCMARQEREAKASSDQDEAVQMSFDKSARARMCAEVPPDQRTGAQAIACEHDQQDKDELTGLGMLSNGPEVARQCGDRIDARREGALMFACLSYRMALSHELGGLLARDEGAWAIMCPGADDDFIENSDRAAFVDQACRTAREKRKNLAAERMLADPVALAKTCETVSRYDYATVEGLACGLFSDAEIQRLARDPVAFNAACARYGNRLTERRGDLDEPGERCANAYFFRRNTEARRKAEANGKHCLGEPNYSGDLPTCLTPREYEKEMASRQSTMIVSSKRVDITLDPYSSLNKAARQKAEQIIAQAKADRTYPKRLPDDDLY